MANSWRYADAVPPSVLHILQDAYGDDVGEAHFSVQGHQLEDKTYGELLPGGCAKAFRCLGLTDSSTSSGAGLLLDLGMGSGMAALQAFVQCPKLSRVVGVETSWPRFCLAVAALQRLTAARPHQFKLAMHADGSADVDCPLGEESLAYSCFLEVEDGVLERSTRRLEFRYGSFLNPEVLGDDDFRAAQTVLLQVMLPEESLPRLHERLSLVEDGCRLFCVCNVRNSWCVQHPCHLKPWCCLGGPYRDDVAGGNVEECIDHYATAWNQNGAIFHTWRVDKLHPGVFALQPTDEHGQVACLGYPIQVGDPMNLYGIMSQPSVQCAATGLQRKGLKDSDRLISKGVPLNKCIDLLSSCSSSIARSRKVL